MTIIKALSRLCLVYASLLASAEASEVVINGGFENGFTGWTCWGKNSNLITLQSKDAHSGTNVARIQHGKNALFFVAPIQRGTAYELRFFYKATGENPSGELNIRFSQANGELGSAGSDKFRLEPTNSAAWTEFRHVFLSPPGAVKCQFSFSADDGSALWMDDVSLKNIAKPAGLTEPPDSWEGLKQHTNRPLFHELLTSEPGHYHVVCWAHDLHRQSKHSGLKSDEFKDDEKWAKEVGIIFKEAGEAGMGFLDLPGRLNRAEPWQTPEFHRQQFEKYGVQYDVWSEGSPSIAAGLKNGAELLSRADADPDKKPSLSWVDPKYVEAQEKILRRLAQQLHGEPFVGVYYGKDEPIIHLPAGKPEHWGPYSQSMAKEVFEKYGFHRFAAPGRTSKALDRDPDKPLRWIAYNRWANDRFVATRRQLHDALHEAAPNAVYNGANYWFMSGFVPFDYSQLAASADLMELDPYASSAEIRRGRGVFNHSFGAKFMSDLTGKPVRIIVQAFDYKGYAMSPEDLREWVSQSMRGGASAIDYYTLDSPRWFHCDRWKMMLHLSSTITRMHRIDLPTDADTAVLYTLYTHMSQGSSTKGDQLYAAHTLVGEQAGSWFHFISDAQLERGEKSLAKYKVVYLPLARYMTAEVTAKLEEYVKGGGMLICGDAEAFSFDLSGGDTSAARERFLGFKTLGPKNAEKISVSSDRFGLAAGTILPLFDVTLWDETSCGRARKIQVTDSSAEILGEYPDGSPAIVSHAMGRGRVIAFAANPFSPRVAVDKTPWPALVKQLQRTAGCKVDRPIWRFVIP